MSERSALFVPAGGSLAGIFRGELANRAAAVSHGRRFVCHAATQASDAHVASKGVDPAALRPAREALASNQGIDVAAELLPSELVEQLIIAGTPDDCGDRLAEWLDYAEVEGFEQVLIGVPVGPDVREAVSLWASDIVRRA